MTTGELIATMISMFAFIIWMLVTDVQINSMQKNILVIQTKLEMK
jgi:hypothetical protein